MFPVCANQVSAGKAEELSTHKRMSDASLHSYIHNRYLHNLITTAFEGLGDIGKPQMVDMPAVDVEELEVSERMI